jgi:hypothetical protein
VNRAGPKLGVSRLPDGAHRDSVAFTNDDFATRRFPQFAATRMADMHGALNTDVHILAKQSANIARVHSPFAQRPRFA